MSVIWKGWKRATLFALVKQNEASPLSKSLMRMLLERKFILAEEIQREDVVNVVV
jgi:hypothetical protein